ncbi:MAG: phospho-N-acetylmuramoyl-pentapeptide-transferase [Clostridia bacterium]|nr:phospho-N-acetylmuramoyl-pentapeptide-transferase [Clostridia bacterium]
MFKQLVTEFLAVGVSSFLVTAILCHYIIPALSKKHIGQSIRAEGPQSHRVKAGTPTMGGICFIMGMFIVLAAVAVIYAFRGTQNELIPLALTACLALLNGFIGLFDDFRKLVKHENEGLKAGQKFILQCAAAALYLWIMTLSGHIDTLLHIPFTDIVIDLGIGYYIGAMFFIVGLVNSVNLTDGIDGLATAVTLVVTAFIAFVGLNMLNTSMTLISAALIGSLLAFLRKNCHVAEVFMGDTGSLFLGGAMAGAAFMINDILVMVIACGVFIFETLSVVIQVTAFKTTNKRVFLMTPIHHHFEAKKWSENKIVVVFSLVSLALCVLAWFGL